MVYLEAELEGGRRGYIKENVVESTSHKEDLSLSVSKDSRSGIVKGFGGGREVSGYVCIHEFGRGSEGSN